MNILDLYQYGWFLFFGAGIAGVIFEVVWGVVYALFSGLTKSTRVGLHNRVAFNGGDGRGAGGMHRSWRLDGLERPVEIVLVPRAVPSIGTERMAAASSGIEPLPGGGRARLPGVSRCKPCAFGAGSNEIIRKDR